MTKVIIKAFFTFLTIGLLFGGQAFAQQKSDSSHAHKTMQMKDHKMMDHSKMMDSTHKKMSHKKDSIVREGLIDLQKIDKNKDGKVFQDMMDYNVISDKAGKCPLCGMKLKEVSLKKARETLLKSGHKVK